MKKILFAAPHHYSSVARVGGHQYARLFSENDWKVLYVSNFLSPFNLLGNIRSDAFKKRFSNYLRNGEAVSPSLASYVPLTLLPHHNFTFLDQKWILDNYYRFSLPPLAPLLKKRGFDRVELLWLDCPNQLFWKKIIPHQVSVYRISDAIESFPNSGKNLLKAHDEAIRTCDVVIISSKVLKGELEHRYPSVVFHYCPNGVDLSNFIREDYVVPEEYRELRGKIALYVGAIDEWFDAELLVRSADHCPDMNFVVIGPDRTSRMSAVRRPNIHYLGSKSYTDIPNYMHYAQMGIIPFKKTDLVRCVNPIKMYEFFSLGKPVISTSWEELELLGSPCFLAKTPQEFIELVSQAKEPARSSAEELIQYARDNTWTKRFDFLMDLMHPAAIKVS